MFIETEYSDSRKENTRSNDQVDLFALFHVSREIPGRGIVAWSVARGIKGKRRWRNGKRRRQTWNSRTIQFLSLTRIFVMSSLSLSKCLLID